MSSRNDGYELLSIPIETIIGFGMASDRISLSLTNKRNSTKSTITSTTNTSYSSELASNVAELRGKFEHFLSSGDLKDLALVNLQKLQFLDEFFDNKKRRAKQYNTWRSVFDSCHHYLNNVLITTENTSIIQHATSQCLLAQLDSIDTPKIMPVLSNHQYMRMWFAKMHKQLLSFKSNSSEKDIKENMASTSCYESSSNEEFNDGQLVILVSMIYNQVRDFFFYFQNTERRYFKKWLKNNLTMLPRYLLEDLNAKNERNQRFKESLLYKEEDMSTTTILDTDFDFLMHLGEMTSDWKLLNRSQVLGYNFYGSKENYTSIPGTKTHKYICRYDYSIETMIKAFLGYDYFNDNDNFICGEYRNYNALDITKSSKKYSCVTRTVTVDLGRFFAKRTQESVFTTRARFIAGELVEVIYLFKTCNIDTSKDKAFSVGGMIFTKDDANKVRAVDIKMFNLGGILQTDFIINNIGTAVYVKQWGPVINNMIKYLEDHDYKAPNPDEKPLWRTFSEFCQAHCRVDVSKL